MKTAELFHVNIDPPVTLQAGIEYECVIRERRQWLPKPSAPGWWWLAIWSEFYRQWKIQAAYYSASVFAELAAEPANENYRWQQLPTPQPPEQTL